ncbi:MAG TPA: V-type ATPase 116kDa subunit family protein [Kofleriaceae bacterium]|nr:V-type ATPase 116kDa subunit family protein [Kofleriaceae bacterium]
MTGNHRRFTVHLLRLRSDGPTLRRLREVLARVFGEHELRNRPLPGGEVALLLLAPAGRSDDLERLLAEARVETAPVPVALGGGSLLEALPRLRTRLAEIDRELEAIAADARRLADRHGPALEAARRAFRDELCALDARERVAETDHAFVIEGWVPTRARAALVAGIRRALGGTVDVEELSRDQWHGSEAPVVLTNPAFFEPFERLTSMLPLPRYGTVDPTPFVAVFFPLLFGVIVGDVGYAALLAIIAAILWRRGPRRGLARDLARIAAAVACYAAIFGLLYGELFGDLGARWFGLRPLWLDREEAILPFLGLAIALGLVHMLLGLVVSAIGRRRRPREAAGRGLTALMLALIAVALAAMLELLPHALFTPAIIALLAAFPVLIALEGAAALLELITTVGHVFSYARVMALGTASVMLAIVANQMVGAFGGAAIGVVFALLFHLVNFGIALFSPTIHVLRLHYVEFFGTFFDPGGGPYRPFTHALDTGGPPAGPT